FTSAQLRKLLNIFDENLAALKTIELPVDSWSFVMLNMSLKRIPPSLRTRFELSLDSPTDIPKYEVLNKFLVTMCQSSENALLTGTSKPQYSAQGSFPVSSKPKSSLLIKSDPQTCPCCSSQHA